jgi:hypothetical protein
MEKEDTIKSYTVFLEYVKVLVDPFSAVMYIVRVLTCPDTWHTAKLL